MAAWFTRARRRIGVLLKQLKDEHASPKQVGWAVGLGVFIGCTPALGFHGGIALAAATALRLNKIWTWVGSRVSNPLILPWIVLVEVELSHRVRTGAWAEISVDRALAEGHLLLLDWILGAIPVGLCLAALLGPASYAIARFKASRTLAPPPPPSSESPT